ncbi:hypothetical protein GF356_01330 [candidate division GN15 bacterium]|nr:hypothetical protein [candidate division GN15 bacterium]
MSRSTVHRCVIAAGVLIAAFMLCTAESQAQPAGQGVKQWEEIPVSFEVRRLLKQDIFVQWDGDTVYVPLLRVFDLLDLKVEADFTDSLFRGFVIDRDNSYRLDLGQGEARTWLTTMPITPADYYLGNSDVFLRVDLFDKLFDLPMEFIFSALMINLPLNTELPAYQRMQRAMARRGLKEEQVAARNVRDLAHDREFLQFGALDWMISANPVGNKEHFYGLNLGSMLAGGDLTVNAIGNTVNGLQSDQMTYLWHYYTDRSPYITQIEAGHTYGQGQLGRNLIGAMVTNRPQTQREFFQTITLEGYLGEGWEVELYIDGNLADYTYTDGNGEYRFDVDLVYGASMITLKMYGPNGEYRTEEQYVRIPYNLIPAGQIEYTVAGGQTAVPEQYDSYANAAVYYGLHPRVTVGMSSDMPLATDSTIGAAYALEATTQPLSNLTLFGSYSPDVAVQADAAYTQVSSFSFSAGYSRYEENPYRNQSGREYQVRASTTFPFRLFGRQWGVRGNATFDQFPDLRMLQINYGFNVGLPRFYINYLGRLRQQEYPDRTTTSLTSQMYLLTRLLPWFNPQFRATYDHEVNDFSVIGVNLARRIFRTGQLTLGIEHNRQTGANTFQLTFNIYAPFANFNSRATYNDAQQDLAVNQVQRGSVRWDHAARRLRFDRRNGVGYGSALLRPFVDANANNRRDASERFVPNVRARIKGVGGRPIGDHRQYFYDRLRPYDDYLLRIDQYSIDDPYLKPVYENYAVTFNPNMVTAIDIPLVYAAEVTGTVEREVDDVTSGVGGVKLIIHDVTRDRKAAEITTFRSGEYYHLGLIPGKYTVQIDPHQLSQLGYVSVPEQRTLEVLPQDASSQIGNIDFILKPRQ